VLRKIQYSLATATAPLTSRDYPGIFIRGGLTVGDISYGPDELRVFGPAVNRAVHLEKGTEKKPNKNPIITLDADCLHSSKPLFDEPLKNGAIAKDEEGRFFIDYLTPQLLPKVVRSNNVIQTPSGVSFTYEDSYLAAIAVLQDLRKMMLVLTKRLKAHENDDDSSIHKKYAWAAERHNAAVCRFVEATRDYQLGGEDLLINNTSQRRKG